MFRNFNKSSGQASRLLLVLAIVVLVAVIITFLIMKMAEKPPAPSVNNNNTTPVQLPVYEKQLGNIDFIFESAKDRGTVLKASDVTPTQYSYYQTTDLPVSSSGGKFIQVTVGARNEGTENTDGGAWDMENIVDSQGRNFVPDDQGVVNPWLPTPDQDLCGALLKPAFDPVPCTRIYEVSVESTGLKVTIKNGNSTALLDLIVK